MPREVRFKLDENLPASLVATFQEAGHEAVSTVAQGLQGGSDSTIAKVCRSEERILVTLDGGFADIRAYPPAESSGIVVLRLRVQTIAHIKTTIGRVLRLLAERNAHGALWIVEENRVRFRS